ncbi:TPA: hypothetical protein GF860_11100 [Citrobacter koseri]|nr:hypothetical protein [Citrobacter koseri]
MCFVPLVTSLSHSKRDNRTARCSAELIEHLVTIIILNSDKGIYMTLFCDTHQLITSVKYRFLWIHSLQNDRS